MAHKIGTTLTCGCKLHADGHGIEWCPTHAAAPELLEACRMVERACSNVSINLARAFVWSRGDGTQAGGYGDRVYLLETIRAAIAKATGQ